MLSVFTLVICLVVVALSGAAVLRITLVDQTKRATVRARQPHDSRPPRSSVSPGGSSPEAAPVTPTEVQAELVPAPVPEPAPEPAREDEGERATEAVPTPQTGVRIEPEVRPSPEPEPAPAPAGRRLPVPAMVIDVHRGRSAGLLLLLLTVLGGVIALVVAAGAVVAVVALRAALVG